MIRTLGFVRKHGFRVADTAKGILRTLARNRVIRKRLPADVGGGVIFCSPDALLSTWKPGWQSDQALHLFEWVRRFVSRGDVVWDIGANQGLFSFAAAAVSGESGHVVAFEPDPFLVGLLCRSRHAQRAEGRVDILPVAVGGRSAVDTFCVAAKDRALNHLANVAGNPRTEGVRERLTVKLAVLTHAGTRLLHQVRPLWIIEVETDNSGGIAELMRAARYRFFDANDPDEELTCPTWNTLVVPEEKCGRRSCGLGAAKGLSLNV
jgi:FkbM family methyltransferase